MAISYQKVATGQAFAGSSSFNIGLSSTANDFVVVAFTSDGAGVTSITDTGGNTYRQIPGTDLWRTDKVKAAASGTITVNLNDSTGIAGAVAASYRNVAFADYGIGSNSGSSNNPSSGSRSLADTGDFLIGMATMGFAVTFTAQNGNLRGQVNDVDVGAYAVCLIDNTGSASVTDSVTATSHPWIVDYVILRSLPIADQLTLSDANVLLMAVYATWNDTLNVWDDSGFSKQLIDETLPLSQTGADSLLSNWNDAVGKWLSFLWSPSDNLAASLADVLKLGFANLLSDNLAASLADARSLGFGNSVSDNLAAWSDGRNLGFGSSVSDNLAANLADALKGLGFGNSLTDNLAAWSDARNLFMQMFFQSADTLTMLDSIATEGGDALTRTLTDSFSLTDNLNIGWSMQLSDGFTLLDILTLRRELQLLDSFTLLDTLTLQRELKHSDSMSLSDDINRSLIDEFLALSQTATDSMSLTDAATRLLSMLLSGLNDTLAQSDASTRLLSMLLSGLNDTLTQADAWAGLFAMRATFAETLTMTDWAYIISPEMVVNLTKQVNDTMGTMTDRGMQGPRNGTFTGTSWTNTPGAVTRNDSSYASYHLPSPPQSTTSLYFSAAVFSIPNNSPIEGFTATVRKLSYGDGMVDDNVHLSKTAGVPIGTNKALGDIWSTSWTDVDYGSATDKWGSTWTAADVNGSGFGLVFSALNDGTGADYATIDYVAVTVYYAMFEYLLAVPLEKTCADTFSAFSDAVLYGVGGTRNLNDSMNVMTDACVQEVRFKTYPPQSGFIWGPLARRIGRPGQGVNR